MITRTMAEVMVDDLEDNLMEAEMMIKRTRMRLAVVVRTRGKIIPIRTIKIREEDEEGKELKEEASMENVFTATKKGINHLNVLSAKEGMIEEILAG